MENKTMRSVLWQKIVATVESHTIREAALFIGLFFVAGILSAAAFDMAAAARAVDAVMEYRHNFIPTSVLIFAATFYAPRMIQRAVEALSDMAAYPDEEVEGETIEGIPTAELLDHLFTAKTFKRGDIEKKFGMPRNRYAALATRLKDLGVLTHGMNNATILADVSREEVANILAGKETAKELAHEVRVVRATPALPSPTAAFKSRLITANA